MQVSELKKTKVLWETLEREKEIVLTRDGKPEAVMIPINSENFDAVRHAIRNARFSQAIGKIQGRVKENPVTDKEIESEIQASRAECIAKQKGIK